jgi:hypothetical protein
MKTIRVLSLAVGASATALAGCAAETEKPAPAPIPKPADLGTTPKDCLDDCETQSGRDYRVCENYGGSISECDQYVADGLEACYATCGS